VQPEVTYIYWNYLTDNNYLKVNGPGPIGLHDPSKFLIFSNAIDAVVKQLSKAPIDQHELVAEMVKELCEEK
jgi:hypothetical protein